VVSVVWCVELGGAPLQKCNELLFLKIKLILNIASITRERKNEKRRKRERERKRKR
jgi:hypothetical protein